MFTYALCKGCVKITLVFLCLYASLFATSWFQDMPIGIKNFEGDMQKSYVIDSHGQKTVFSHKLVLQNGMTVIVREQHNIPKVSIQLWYNVGSKDEGLGQKGIAHLIEHMIFKGTTDRVGKSLNLSESDLNEFAHKLSGDMNAFTSYDFTGYLFNMPTQHYAHVFPIMADCMVNARFDDDMLNSEMKAVIQELKRDRDNYSRELLQQMIAAILPDHPYHYPIIGFKEDLWAVSGADLYNFYQNHYVPNNATLVVVGDVDHEEVFADAKKYFEHIASNQQYKKYDFSTHPDIISKSVSLYRDVKQPQIYFSFVTPGAKEKSDVALETIAWVLAKKRNSRLYKKLVNETKLAVSVSAMYWDMFDYSFFMIAVYPKKIEDLAYIEKIIKDELQDIAQNGFTDEEFDRAMKNSQMDLYGVLEDIEQQAYMMGQSYLATGDESYIFNSLENQKKVRSDAHNMILQYFRPTVINTGLLLQLPESEQETWIQLQKKSDQKDKEILSNRIRNSKIEPAVYAKKIQALDPQAFNYPKPEVYYISNGIKVLQYADDDMKKATIELKLKARSCYDLQEKQGLYNFVADMLLEGTKNYTDDELAQIIESKGISISIYPGGITINLLSEDIPFGLEILQELLTNAIFPEDHIEKVREQILTQIKRFWDDPKYFSNQLIQEKMYPGHPYAKNSLGSIESINSITKDDLVNFYAKYFSPDGARLAIVGDLEYLDIKKLLESTLGKWAGPLVEDIIYPELKDVISSEQLYKINRDQVYLAFARLSVNRDNSDYEKLLIFDRIFSGGPASSMASRLFALREATGLFYSIGGSLVSGADEQKGLFKVKTIVSLDRLDEAVKEIKQVIDTVADTITDEELLQAKRAIVNGQIDYYATSVDIAEIFLYLDRFNLPFDFFDTRMQRLDKISKEDIVKAIKKYLQSETMVTFKIGRV